jgi:ferritin
MPSSAFVTQLNEQIGHEFAAHQQYVAIAAYYEAETLPRLAHVFYGQALEERGHAMMMIQYLLDADADVIVPGVDAPQVGFVDIVAPVALALEQEKRVSAQINALAASARAEGDYSSEQFMQWFIKEQVEEVSKMNDLLTVVRRSVDDPMRAEEYIARESFGDEGEDGSAPPQAGGG